MSIMEFLIILVVSLFMIGAPLALSSQAKGETLRHSHVCCTLESSGKVLRRYPGALPTIREPQAISKHHFIAQDLLSGF